MPQLEEPPPPTFESLELLTPRLRLRPLQDADADALFAIFSDPEVMRYWSTLPWTSLQQARDLITRDQAAHRSGDYVRLGLERRDDGVLIGNCTLFGLNRGSRRAEMGYGQLRAAWGRGYMGEALEALLHYGFGPLGLNRVEADIDPRNEASGRALERLGFQREGFLRERWIVGDEVSDSALYGLLRSDWVARG